MSVNPGRPTSTHWWTPGSSTRSSEPSRGRAWSGLVAITRTSTTASPSAPPPALACGTRSLTQPPSQGGSTSTRWMIRRCTMRTIAILRPWIKWGTWWWRESLMEEAMGPHMGEFLFQLFAKLGFTIDQGSGSPSTWICALMGNNVRILSASISSYNSRTAFSVKLCKQVRSSSAHGLVSRQRNLKRRLKTIEKYVQWTSAHLTLKCSDD